MGTYGKPVCDFLCVNNSTVTYPSCTVSEIWWIIGEIFGVDGEGVLL